MRAEGQMAARVTWQAGQRVIRKDSEEEGTVLEAGTAIKVKWDGGRTSYFVNRNEANVQLIPKRQDATNGS